MKLLMVSIFLVISTVSIASEADTNCIAMSDNRVKIIEVKNDTKIVKTEEVTKQ